MKKDINKVIIRYLLEALVFPVLLILGIFLMKNPSLKTYLAESSYATQCIFFVFIGAFILIGGIESLVLILTGILYACEPIINRCYIWSEDRCSKKLKRKIPRNTKLDIIQINWEDEHIRKLLYENIKCTATFDGSTVFIEISLPEKISEKTNNIIWFYNNFDY